MRLHIFAIGLIAALAPGAATAAPCPGNADALGTERVLTVTASSTPRVGHKQFPTTLPLADKELVLTFDDGPWPTTTPRVLNALKAECVRATFFLLGRNVDAHPALVRRALAEGHSLGHHTYSHPLLNHMPPAKAEAEIDRGISRNEKSRRGIVLLHDTKAQTANMLPALLRALKKRGYHIVHVEPASGGRAIN